MNDIAYTDRIIREFDKIIFISEKFCEAFKQIDFGQRNLTHQKILILSAQQFDIGEKQVILWQVNPEQAMYLRLLYHTYEFADNFILIEKTPIYATIFNYVQVGILTWEEAWQALLDV